MNDLKLQIGKKYNIVTKGGSLRVVGKITAILSYSSAIEFPFDLNALLVNEKIILGNKTIEQYFDDKLIYKLESEENNNNIFLLWDEILSDNLVSLDSRYKITLDVSILNSSVNINEITQRLESIDFREDPDSPVSETNSKQTTIKVLEYSTDAISDESNKTREALLNDAAKLLSNIKTNKLENLLNTLATFSPDAFNQKSLENYTSKQEVESDNVLNEILNT